MQATQCHIYLSLCPSVNTHIQQNSSWKSLRNAFCLLKSKSFNKSVLVWRRLWCSALPVFFQSPQPQQQPQGGSKTEVTAIDISWQPVYQHLHPAPLWARSGALWPRSHLGGGCLTTRSLVSCSRKKSMLWIQQHKGVNAENMSSSQTQIWILRAISFTAPVPSDINYTMSCQLDFLWHSSVTNPLMTASLTALASKRRGQKGRTEVGGAASLWRTETNPRLKTKVEFISFGKCKALLCVSAVTRAATFGQRKQKLSRLNSDPAQTDKMFNHESDKVEQLHSEKFMQFLIAWAGFTRLGGTPNFSSVLFLDYTFSTS